MPTARLALTTGESEQLYAFSGDAVIGRGERADISIPDPSISRRHAHARLEGHTVVLEDLDSANGTAVNGEPVRAAVRAEEGDVIRIGAVELELRIDDEAVTSDPIATPTEVLSAETLAEVERRAR